MTFSAKVVAGGVLTFFMLGLSGLMQHGQFIAPFPFISEFVLVMLLVIVVNALKSFRWKSVPFITYAITGALCGRFLWEILLPLDDIVYLFEETLIIDSLFILHFVALIMCIVSIASWIPSKKMKWVHLIFIPLLIAFILHRNGQFLFGWFVLYGAVSLLSLNDNESSENGLKESLEFFSGLGLIYLMSIISILWN